MGRTRTLLIAGAALGALSSAAAAHGNVGFSVTIGVPAYGPPVYYAPPPVYYAPPPVVYYAPPRAYYPPPRVYYGPPSHYRDHRHGHGQSFRHERRHGRW
jgi:hypothetical protein